MISCLFLGLHFYQAIAAFFLEKGWMQGGYVECVVFGGLVVLSFLGITFLIVLQSIIVEVKFIPLLDRPLGFFCGVFEIYFLYLILLTGLFLYPVPSEKIPLEVVKESRIAAWSIGFLNYGYNLSCERLGVNKLFCVEKFLKNKKDFFPDYSTIQ